MTILENAQRMDQQASVQKSAAAALKAVKKAQYLQREEIHHSAVRTQLLALITKELGLNSSKLKLGKVGEYREGRSLSDRVYAVRVLTSKGKSSILVAVLSDEVDFLNHGMNAKQSISFALGSVGYFGVRIPISTVRAARMLERML